MIDTLGRKSLWDVGLDYMHGTGHGVGAYLNVHEGPFSISYRDNPYDCGLREGMFSSIGKFCVNTCIWIAGRLWFLLKLTRCLFSLFLYWHLFTLRPFGAEINSSDSSIELLNVGLIESLVLCNNTWPNWALAYLHEVSPGELIDAEFYNSVNRRLNLRWLEMVILWLLAHHKKIHFRVPDTIICHLTKKWFNSNKILRMYVCIFDYRAWIL